jgi:hypothetical protein
VVLIVMKNNSNEELIEVTKTNFRFHFEVLIEVTHNFNEGLIEMTQKISSPFVVLIQVTKKFETRGVSHFGLAISIKKYLKAKEEL